MKRFEVPCTTNTENARTFSGQTWSNWQHITWYYYTLIGFTSTCWLQGVLYFILLRNAVKVYKKIVHNILLFLQINCSEHKNGFLHFYLLRLLLLCPIRHKLLSKLAWNGRRRLVAVWLFCRSCAQAGKFFCDPLPLPTAVQPPHCTENEACCVCKNAAVKNSLRWKTRCGSNCSRALVLTVRELSGILNISDGSAKTIIKQHLQYSPNGSRVYWQKNTRVHGCKWRNHCHHGTSRKGTFFGLYRDNVRDVGALLHAWEQMFFNAVASPRVSETKKSENHVLCWEGYDHHLLGL